MKCAIVFTTKYGCVEKAARLLAEKLGGAVTLINLMKVKVPDVGNFDTLILGGSIYMGKIQKEMISFIKQHEAELLQKRLGVFICAAQEPKTAKQELEEAFPAQLLQHAVVKENLGYEFDFQKMNFVDKTATKLIAKTKKSIFALSEDAITGFAKQIKCI